MAANPPHNQPHAQATNIITALGNAFKSQTGDPLPGEHIAQLLIANMSQLGELAKQGKLTQQQIAQVHVTSNRPSHSRTLATTCLPIGLNDDDITNIDSRLLPSVGARVIGYSEHL